MQIKQMRFKQAMQPNSLINITKKISDFVDNECRIQEGLCNIFLPHTSASLIFCENYDPAVLTDLKKFMDKLVPKDEKLYTHIAEGKDDMPSHIKTILTQNSLTVPVANKRLLLGQWQGIFLWEHRDFPRERCLYISVIGHS